MREFIGVVPPSNDSEEPQIVAIVRQRPNGEWNVDKRTKIIERTFLDNGFKIVPTSLYSFMKEIEATE
jgi:hypothetical protein